MSTGPTTRVSPLDIQLVQNVIERCLQLYMNQMEVVETLRTQAKIEPDFTELVWKKLEEENKEFFKAYYLRLILKNQILEFNNLLEQQVRLMRQILTTTIPTSNGSHIPPLTQKSDCYPSEHAGSDLKPENMNHPAASGLSVPFNNGGSSLHTSLHSAVEMHPAVSRIVPQQNMLSTQNSDIGLIEGGNGTIIKQEGGYSGRSSYMFGDGIVLETCQPVTNASLCSLEATSQSLNEPLLDADTSTFGIFCHIPRSFSLTDLSEEFSQRSDILENYPRSPFLGTDSENFLDSCERREHQGDNKRLDSMSGDLSFEDFGSE